MGAIVGQGGDWLPNIWGISYNQISLQKVGDYWEFDTYSETVEYTAAEDTAVFETSSEIINIGVASFSQS